MSALNLGPSFLKAVARGKNGDNSRGSELVRLQQVAEIRISQGVGIRMAAGQTLLSLKELVPQMQSHGMEEERGRRASRVELFSFGRSQNQGSVWTQ